MNLTQGVLEESGRGKVALPDFLVSPELELAHWLSYPGEQGWASLRDRLGIQEPDPWRQEQLDQRAAGLVEKYKGIFKAFNIDDETIEDKLYPAIFTSATISADNGNWMETWAYAAAMGGRKKAEVDKLVKKSVTNFRERRARSMVYDMEVANEEGRKAIKNKALEMWRLHVEDDTNPFSFTQEQYDRIVRRDKDLSADEAGMARVYTGEVK
jgi:hypothetical protein